MLLLAVFMPWAANGQEPLTIGDGTSYSPTGSGNPTGTTNGAGSPMGNTYFYNSTAQFIYTAEELGTAKIINSVAFYHNAKSLVGTVKIYLFHTTESTVNTSSYITSGTPLYTGTNITLGGSSAGWQEFTLETPFEYNGTDNLLVIVCRTKRSDGGTPSYNTDLAWQYTSTSENYRYMMRSNDTEATVALSNTTTAYVQSYYRPNIQIGYELPSDCEKPDTFEASNVTHNSATLTWSGGSGTYNVEVKGGDWANWTEILHETALTSTDLENLKIVTDYQARIQSVCTNEPSGWKTTSFATECGPINIGYQCGFEGPNTGGTTSYPLPACWTRITEQTTSLYPYVYNYGSPKTGSYHLYFYSSSNSSAEEIAIMPEIDGGLNGKRLSFYQKGAYSFSIGYMTDPTNAATFVAVETRTGESYYQFYEVDFGEYTNDPRYIAIKSNFTSNYQSIYFDDVTLVNSPTCFRPTMGTSATDVAATTAKVSWTPAGENQDHWDVYYCTTTNVAPTATTTPNVTNTADNPCTLTGLTPETKYYVYVRGNCGSGDVSEWSTNYCTFTTTAYCADMQVKTFNATATNYDAATVTWTGAGAATQWKVQCSQDNTFVTVDKEVVADATTANITGLTANKTYYVRIAPYCDEASDYTPWSSNKSFSTPVSCPSPTLAAATNPTAHGATLSWTGSSESYDVMAAMVAVTNYLNANFDDNTIPDGFTNNSTNPWIVVANGYNSSSYCVKSGNAGVNSSTSDLSFEVTLNSPATISFYAKVSSESDDKGRFLIDGTQKVNVSGTSGDWTPYSFELTAGTHTLIWRYYKDGSYASGDDCFYVDNITISSSTVGTWQTVATGITESPYVMDDATIFEPETPYQVKLVGYCPWTEEQTESNIISFTTSSSCETPSNVVASEITYNSAKISWDTHGLTTFNLRYSSNGGNTWEEPITNITCPYILPGLTGNTAYQVQVQTTCGNETWSASGNFTTECGPISVATEAYTYGFEDVLPWNCWTVASGSSVTRKSTSGNSHEGSYYMCFNGTQENVIEMPSFEQATNTLRLEFWVRPEDYSNSKCGSLAIGYYNATNEFVALKTYAYNTTTNKYDGWESSTYIKEHIDLDVDSDNDGTPDIPDNANIVFRQFNTTYNYWWYVDDVKVKIIPTCEDVDNVTASNITNHSANITWTADEAQNAWQIAYKAGANFNPNDATELATATVIDATSNSYLFDNNLEAETAYYMYVRANCTASENGYGDWSDSYATFTTAASAPAPTAFNKTDVGPDWVDLYWTAPAGDRLSGYGIYYATTSTAPTAETEALVTIDNPAAPTSETPHRLQGLANETIYYIWVRANHETGVYSAWTPITGSSITTLVACPTPTALTAENITYTTADLTWTGYSDSYTVEYREVITAPVETNLNYGFEDGTMQGWTSYDEDGDNSGWSVQSGSSYTHGGSSYCVQAVYNGNAVPNNWLISPEIPLGGTLSFYAKRSNAGTGEQFQVYVSTTGTDIANFTAISELINAPITYANNPYEYDLSSYSGNGYVAIRHTAEVNQYWLFVDDICITNSTPGVYGDWVTATDNATNGAYTVTGLFANTKYEVRVKGNCDGGEWSDAINFTTPAFTKDISAYTGNDNGWYLIASPVAEDITPSESNGFLTNTYDLYRFNQNPTINDDEEYLEWENYKKHNFAIESGKGYLYANSEDVTLTFTGTPYTGDGKVTLTYSEDNPDANMHGWNLVGNPFGVNAYINQSFFTLDGSSDFVSQSASTAIAPMQGILVRTNAETTLTFSTTAPEGSNGKGSINIDVVGAGNHRGNSLIDRAIVSFNEGDALPKFQLNPNHTKVYIPQGNKDYSVVCSNGQGEMPVNFKVRENGTYTLTVNPENVEMNYLHLIDNMTGADIDLLQTPSYSFNATTRDYESRFRLVFSVNGENGASTGSATFAFFSNGNLIIGNEGEATLQVVDLMGHVLSSETINGSHSMSLNVAPGVYMIRLINGNNVKVQKIVVR